MPEIHLRQPRFTYSACGPFTQNKERIQKIKEAGDSRYIYQSKLGKADVKAEKTYLKKATGVDKLTNAVKNDVIIKDVYKAT